MVDKSISPFQATFGLVFSSSDRPDRPSPCDMILHPHLAWMPLKQKTAARGTKAPRLPSIVGWFCRLPSPAYVAGSVALPVCHLALVAARAPRAVIREDAQSGNRLATTPDGPAAVKPVGTWPRCVVQGLPRHGARSDSPAQ